MSFSPISNKLKINDNYATIEVSIYYYGTLQVHLSAYLAITESYRGPIER